MGEATQINSVELGTFIDVASWVFNPSEYKVEVSTDNKVFKQVYSKAYEPVVESTPVGPDYLTATFDKVDARFVKVTAKYLRAQPSWAGGAGKPASLFIDEIIIN